MAASAGHAEPDARAGKHCVTGIARGGTGSVEARMSSPRRTPAVCVDASDARAPMGEPGRLAAQIVPEKAGADEAAVFAHRPANGNTGLDRTTVIVPTGTR